MDQTHRGAVWNLRLGFILYFMFWQVVSPRVVGHPGPGYTNSPTPVIHTPETGELPT